MGGKKELNVAKQNLCISEKFPQFKYYRSKEGATWRGYLQPSASSPQYDILIRYPSNSYPNVWVKSPKIDEKVKHVYSNGSLCLFYPKDKEWTREMFIGLTIIPWTAEWLMFYEIWGKTGVWYGIEAPHSNNKG